MCHSYAEQLQTEWMFALTLACFLILFYFILFYLFIFFMDVLDPFTRKNGGYDMSEWVEICTGMWHSK